MLTLSQIQQQAPSVFAEHPWQGVSEKYSFLPTSSIVEALATKGIQPMSVMQSAARIPGKSAFTKHMIRFRPEEYASRVVGGVYPEVVLTNSHDRGSAFVIESGLFRLICSNGMVVSAGTTQSHRVRHMGTSIGEVLDATYRIIDQFPQIESTVAKFQSILLNDTQRETMAQLAMGLRWDADKVPFEAARLLQSRRVVDNSKDLWTTFNVIQENLIRGQHISRRARVVDNSKDWWATSRPAPVVNRSFHSTRAVASIDSNLSINRGLWEIAETFAK